MIRAPLESPESPPSNGALIIKFRPVLRKLWVIIGKAFNGPYNGHINNVPIKNVPINDPYNNWSLMGPMIPFPSI